MAVIWPNAGLVNPQRSIALACHSGRAIENFVGIEPNEDGRRQYEVERTFHKDWKPRRAACGWYNCWGMLFAARRTGIHSDSEVDAILHEEYRLVPEKDYLDDVRLGDIAVYRLKPSRKPAHGGLIIGIGQNGKVFYVLSKWNIGWGEDAHMHKDVAGLMVDGGYIFEIYTDRKDARHVSTQLITLG